MADPRSAAATLEGFAAALLGPPAETAPEGVANPFGGPAVKRFGVYRNNVAVGLKGALADIFPVTRDLVGERFFSAMAGDYIAREPPRTPVIAEYGHGFSDFIATFQPAENLFFLPDIARLERAWLDAYHAEDADPLSPDTLQTLSPDGLMAAALVSHPATRLRRFDSAAVSIFLRVRNGTGLRDFDPSPAETALVTRPHYDVSVLALDDGQAVFFDKLIEGMPICEAAEAATALDPAFDLGGAFSILITSGAFTRLSAARE
ncbi:putative DNA-binding domain-containing protein [Martelella lutilitoris]|uniref:Putative DNA-binding domain-containing protein n=1 Tax=Martelella lutilitoris TaxID=2583532 RepID=A0A7T7HLF0_9HYPH|nr:DNA-binding domain-containing protein [Martelella lutilitoris]QQM31343.1 putative DNA-binding domain-containing protein [Martelella lutilitoris]